MALPWWVAPAVATALAVTAVVALGGSVLLGAARPAVLGEGPPWWAGPVLHAVRDVLAALTLGLLLLAGGGAGPGTARGAVQVRAAEVRAAEVRAPEVRDAEVRLPLVRLATWCSAGAALATAAGAVAAVATVTGGSLLRPAAVGDVPGLAGLGGLRVLGYAVVLLLGVAVVSAAAHRRVALVRLAAAAALATALIGVSGHAAGHEAMVGVMAVHVLASSAWAGGLAALLLLRATGTTDVAAMLPRWSQLAGLCFAAVALSGVAAVVLRWSGGAPTTTWLLVAAAKVVVLVALAAAGRSQRRRVVDRARAGQPVPWRRLARLGAVELVLMCLAAGGGVALTAA